MSAKFSHAVHLDSSSSGGEVADMHKIKLLLKLKPSSEQRLLEDRSIGNIMSMDSEKRQLPGKHTKKCPQCP